MIDPTGGPGAAGQSDATLVCDGGVARPVLQVLGSSGIIGPSGATVIPAAVGLRSKIIGINIICTTWTGEGTLVLKDGAGGSSITLCGRYKTPGVGQTFAFDMGGIVIGVGSVNTLVELNYNVASATFAYQIIYYQAP
jgi:hypothetical protein